MTADTPEDLKPCPLPWCGEPATLVQSGDFYDPGFLCKCMVCGTMGPGHTHPTGAITAWNTRPREKELEDAVYSLFCSLYKDRRGCWQVDADANGNITQVREDFEDVLQRIEGEMK